MLEQRMALTGSYPVSRVPLKIKAEDRGIKPGNLYP